MDFVAQRATKPISNSFCSLTGTLSGWNVQAATNQQKERSNSLRKPGQCWRKYLRFHETKAGGKLAGICLRSGKVLRGVCGADKRPRRSERYIKKRLKQVSRPRHARNAVHP